MKSSILLMFIFAMMTCCLDMCDGADEEEKKTIEDLAGFVKEQTAKLEKFFDEERAAIKKNVTSNLENILNAIVVSNTTALEVYKNVVMPENHKMCPFTAMGKLKTTKSQLMKQFKKFINKVQERIIKLDGRVNTYGKLIIKRCQQLLSQLDHSDEDSMVFIEAKFKIFEKLIINEQSMFMYVISVAHQLLNDRTEELKNDLIKDSNEIEADLIKCING